MTPYVVGVVLGIIVSALGAIVGFDRDRAFYPTALIVIASYYALFAVMGGSQRALVMEVGVGVVFLLAAVIGFKKSMWLVAAGIAGHGVFDFLFHNALITNPGMPVWWPAFCGTIDIVLGAWVAFRYPARASTS